MQDMNKITQLTDEALDSLLDGGPSLHPQRLRIHELADRLRRVADALVILNPEAAETTVLDDLEAEVEDVRARLDAVPRLPGTPAGAPPPTSLLAERSPVSGRCNPVAPPLRMTYRRSKTTGTAVYTEAFEGPEGGVHGGVVSASFDELLGVAQMASGAAGYTAKLTIRFRKVTPLHETIRYEAWVKARDGRQIEVEARSYVEGAEDVTLAEAEGLFIARSHLPVPEHTSSEEE